MTLTESNTVACIVVTFNRKNLLAECVAALLAQSHPLGQLFVFDNGSSDGSYQFLKEEGLLEDPRVIWHRFESNLGWSKAICEGLKIAFEQGFDWFWLMDDDALPERSTLETLLLSSTDDACIYPAYLVHNSVMFSEPISLRVNDGFQRFWCLDQSLCDRVIEGTGAPFLGLLVPRKIVDVVGFPRDDTFIWGDYEYLLRVRKAGFKVLYDFRALLWHPGHDYLSVKLPTLRGLVGKEPRWIERRFYSDRIWKEYYGIRNEVFINIRQGDGRWPDRFRTLYSVITDVFMKIRYGDNKVQRTLYLIRAMRDGLLGKMGKTVTPF